MLAACRGSPQSGHQAAFHAKQGPLHMEPIAVQLHKMPAQPEGGRRARNRAAGRNKKSAAFYKLCHEYETKGHCTIVDCDYAHGKDMLETRLQEKE